MLLVYLITTACYSGCREADFGDAQHPFRSMEDCVAEMTQRRQAKPLLVVETGQFISMNAGPTMGNL